MNIGEANLAAFIERAMKANLEEVTLEMVQQSKKLQSAALYASSVYSGRNTFLQNLQGQLANRGTLSPKQMACVLNNELNREYRSLKTKGEAIPNGIYTVVLENGEHRTIRLKTSYRDEGQQVAQWLMGSDNENDYRTFADVKGREATIWKTYKTNVVAQALLTLLREDIDGVREAGKAYAMRSGNCYICNRRLTTPDSIERGIGPTCAEKGGF